MKTELVLAGDIGGTKTLLALARTDSIKPETVFERRYASRTFADFADVVEHFLGEAGDHRHNVAAVKRAGFGIAGPVVGQRVKVTYLPWEIDAVALAQRFGFAEVRLANDFAAAAAGIPALEEPDLVTLQAGRPEPRGVRVVLGAGTGLGVASLVWHDDDWRVMGGEGGHVGFAPANPLQAQLWSYLHARNGRVTVEQVVSGAGLLSNYRFLLESRAARDEARLLESDDAPAAISRHGLRYPDSLAGEALSLFAEVYGAFAGDLALLMLPKAGVYIAGGIAPKVLARITDGGFLAAFRDKGVHHGLMEDFPLHIVINEKLPLIGAARIATTAPAV